MVIDKERLKKLLLVVLSSDQAGEAMAARDAVVKILKKDGKDVHWLAAHLAGLPPRKVLPEHKPGTAPPTAPMNPATPNAHWTEKIVYCADRMDRLRSKEHEFIQSLMEQFITSERANWHPTFAQEKWLDDIYMRLIRLERATAGGF